MTKRLEDLLNLPSSREIIAEDTQEEETETTEIEEYVEQHVFGRAKIDHALPIVDELDKTTDDELNSIAKMALNSYEDLMNLGYNVEPNRSARIFEIAERMLHTGLRARIAKIDKKLKTVDLQIKREKLDGRKVNNNRTHSEINTDEGYVITDRNSLIKKLILENNSDDNIH